jgi:hypothetical protein
MKYSHHIIDKQTSNRKNVEYIKYNKKVIKIIVIH